MPAPELPLGVEQNPDLEFAMPPSLERRAQRVARRRLLALIQPGIILGYKPGTIQYARMPFVSGIVDVVSAATLLPRDGNDVVVQRWWLSKEVTDPDDPTQTRTLIKDYFVDPTAPTRRKVMLFTSVHPKVQSREQLSDASPPHIDYNPLRHTAPLQLFIGDTYDKEVKMLAGLEFDGASEQEYLDDLHGLTSNDQRLLLGTVPVQRLVTGFALGEAA